MKLFYTVNSGVYLSGNGNALLIDGVHRGEKVAFSPMPSELKAWLRTGGGPVSPIDGVLFTHGHPDHFDPDGLALLPPDLPVYGPKVRRANSRSILTGVTQVLIGNGAILALDTVHAGADFAQVPHCSYLLHFGDGWTFVAGDAYLGEREALWLKKLCGSAPRTVLVNPCQLLDPAGHAFLRLLKPEQVLLYHLPRREEDRLGCYALAKQAQARYPHDLPPLIRLEPMSWLLEDTPQIEKDAAM